jgi:mannosyltransferase OCH1-like enzyme
LYKFGGVYADAKTKLLRPLDEIIRPDDELVLVRDLPKQCLLNGFIACRAEHPLLKHAIDISLERIEAREYGKDALDITGPSIFARAFCRWMGHPEETMTMDMGYTSTFQMLGRTSDKKYIISPEGETLLQKEYDSYYTEDINVNFHYPKLWGIRAVYGDAPPWNTPRRPEPPAESLNEPSLSER